jgi:membrane-associated protease RseP (regulator of RpoE activity)
MLTLAAVIAIVVVAIAHEAGQLVTARAFGIPARLRVPLVEITAPTRRKRALVVAGGLAGAYIGLAALAFVELTLDGVPNGTTLEVREVLAGYDAEGKLAAGDRIATVDGDHFDPDAGPSLVERVDRKAGAPIVLGIVRDGRPLEVTVVPKPDHEHWRLGIRPMRVFDTRSDLGASVQIAVVFPLAAISVVAGRIYDALAGSGTADPGGPVRIVEEAAVAPSVLRAALFDGTYMLLLLAAVDLVRLVRRPRR